MGKKRNPRTFVPTSQLEGITLDIYQGIINGRNEKELANQYNVELAIVKRIHKRFSVEIQEARNVLEGINNLSTEKVDESVEDISINEEVSNQDVTDEEPKKRGRGVRLSDDLKIQIAEYLEVGHDVKEVAEMLDVSEGSVRKIGREFGVYQTSRQKKEDAVEEVVEVKDNEISIEDDIEEKIKDERKFIQISGERKDIRKVGLCTDRHPMEVNDYIFDKVDTDLMFDYDRQFEICMTWLDKNINRDENGTPIQKLIVFTTGLNCLNGSIFRACVKKEINLDFKHFDVESKKYHVQTILDDFNMVASNPNPVDVLYGKGTIMLFNMSDAAEVNDEFYVVDKNVDDVRTTYIFNSSSDAWANYPEFVEHIGNMRYKEKISLYLDKCVFINGRIRRTNLAKSFNF